MPHSKSPIPSLILLLVVSAGCVKVDESKPLAVPAGPVPESQSPIAAAPTAPRDPLAEPSPEVAAEGDQKPIAEVMAETVSPPMSPEETAPALAGASSAPDDFVAPGPSPEDADSAIELDSPEVKAADPVPLSVGDVIANVDDAVVLITVEDAQGRSIGVGSGFVVGEERLVVTNYHVVRRAVRAHAQLRDGRKIDVESVRGFDKGRDLAVLRLKDAPVELEMIELEKPAELKQGDRLIAVGHPHGFKFTVTTGIVSAVRSTDELPDQFKRFSHWPDDQTWIQTNAAISHGNSGGPLFDQQGKLVGINTWIDPQGENLGFALHVRHLAELMEQLPAESQTLPIAGSTASRALMNPQVIAIQEAFNRDQREYRKKRTSLLGLLSKPKHPAAERVKELVAIADKESGTDTAFEALSAACAIAKTNVDKMEDELKEILVRLIEEHPDHPRMDNVSLEMSSIREQHVFDFQRQLLAESPHRHIQSTACYCLATGLANSAWRRTVQPEVVHYWQRTLDDFRDQYLEIYGGGAPMNLGKTAEQVLFRSKHLVAGKSPPNISGDDHAGEPLDLAEYLGQVVLLTFSADWNEKCRNLYEHKRRWIEQYADRPFAVLDVSMDTPERIGHLVEEKTISWRLWPDGPKGPIAKQWHIESVPIVLVLDRCGVVRGAFWVRGDELVEKVESAIEATLTQPFTKLQEDLLSSHDAAWKFTIASEQASDNWREPDFDDGRWQSGATPLGFGSYDEKTVLDFEPTVTEQWTTLLRNSFDVADVDAIQDLVVSLKCDDGAAVYLNGKEVIRQCLPAEATIDDPATYDDDRDGRFADLYAIDTDLLVPGRNVVAVELHQATGSSDLRFDLSLTANVVESLQEQIDSVDVTQRLDAIQTLGRLGDAAAAAVAQLEESLDDEDMRVRIRALEALLLIEPARSEDEIPKPKDDEEKELRKHLNSWLNATSWALGFGKDNTPANYQRAWRMINAAYVLAPREGGAVNTKGTVEYRLGRYEDAIETLNQSLRLQRNNPFDHAVIAMAHFQLGQTQDARTSLDKAENALEKLDSTTADLAQAESLVGEARALIGESATEEGSPF